MKAFRFTLQPLRTLRQRQEQEAMEAYAGALLERTCALEQLQVADRHLTTAQAEWQRSAQEGCPAAEMARHALHCQTLALKRGQKQMLLNEAERKSNTALKEMLFARQQRQAVEKFLSRQRMAYDQALTREEQKFLDELAQRRVDTSLTHHFSERASL